MASQTRAQRGVEQVGGGVVAFRGVPGGPIDVGTHALPDREIPALGNERHYLIVAEPDDVVDVAAAGALEALQVSKVGNLSATGGVERRLEQLDQHAAVLTLHRAHSGLALDRLVADEVGGEFGRTGELHCGLPQLLAGACAAAAAPR